MPTTDFLRKLGQYLPEEDIALVERAYRYSEKAHAGQRRKSGEPYVTHPLAVATILAGWQLDAQALAAALLHDVLEDTPASKEEISREFDSVVADLVDAVSKLDQLEFSSREEAQAETFRKMVMAMARDVRVILIKLADRLHNMQTLGAMTASARQRIARETRDIYVPIAHRLGLNTLRQGLLDLSFKHLHPWRYRVLVQAAERIRAARQKNVDATLVLLRERLQPYQLNIEVSGRERTVYSAYNKMQEKQARFRQVMEPYGVLVLVDSRRDCYLALGALHEIFKPIPGRFKDYIAIPKANGYQALHTTLFGPDSMPIDVQIRTRDMHFVAETGVAAGWMYRSANDLVHLAETQQSTRRWLKGLLEMQSEEGDSMELVENIKRDLFPEEIYVFTPKGRIMALPRGSTALDFAYAVHTDIGKHCIGARIDHEPLPLRTVLKNGNQVEILTSASARPQPAWLSFVMTGKARSAIRNFLKGQQQHEAVALGERLLRHALTLFNLDPGRLDDAQWQALATRFSSKGKAELLADIGQGRQLPFTVAQALAEETGASATSSVSPRGNVLHLKAGESEGLHYATCCRPLPNDPIVGWLRPGQGLEVHVRDCVVLKRQISRQGGQGEWIDMAWPPKTQGVFITEVRVWAIDRQGLLADLAGAIAQAMANITQVSIDRQQEETVSQTQFQLDVRDRQHLADVIRALRRVAGVRRVQRLRAS